MANDCAMKLLVTGAAGKVGSMLRDGLRASMAVELRLLDLNPILPEIGEEFVLGDVTDVAVVRQAISGCAACVHLAAIPQESTFDKILHTNIQGTWAVFEAARLEGCGRVVFASSNHATGFYPIHDRIGPADPVRPDSYYGASKLFGEALGSLYHDKFGMRVACIRIGSALPRPIDERHLSTWLSPGDLTRLVTACLTSPELGFAIVYGASANRRGWWDLESGRLLGYEPQDDAEAFAADIEPGPPDEFQGGTFTRSDATP
jgi:uronate dehydrogenase